MHKDPALAKHLVVNTRIAFADLFGHMGKVEFYRPTATRLEVYEQRAGVRVQHIAWVRFAVQQLLGGGAVADRSPQASQRRTEKRPVIVGQRRSAAAVCGELLSFGDAIREVRRREIDFPHAGVQPL
jgi:hypothetical protein